MKYEALTAFDKRAADVASNFLRDNLSRELYWKVIKSINKKDVAELQKKYQSDLGEFDPIGPYKYADIPYWVADKVKLVQRMGLSRGRPRRILDIGVGAGHFAAVCAALGHSVVGTDIGVPVYDDICRILGVDRRIEPLVLRQPMRDLGVRFDLVTIIWHTFHILRYHESGYRDHWSTGDWAFLFNDLIENHMALPGEIFMLLNTNVSPLGEAFDQDLLNWCRERGAIVNDATGQVVFADVVGPLPQEAMPHPGAC